MPDKGGGGSKIDRHHKCTTPNANPNPYPTQNPNLDRDPKSLVGSATLLSSVSTVCIVRSNFV